MVTKRPERITLPDNIELEVGFKNHRLVAYSSGKDQAIVNILHVV